jgi:hypothetical protein
MVTVGGAALLVLMWLPPISQQLTANPGNLTLIYRFFSSQHSGQTLGTSVWALVTAFGGPIEGPTNTLVALGGDRPAHAGIDLVLFIVSIGAAVALAIVAGRRRSWFAAGLGVIGVVGTVLALLSITHIVGTLIGYLITWAIALPFTVLVGVGCAWIPPGTGFGRARTTTAWTSALCLAAVATSCLLLIEVIQIPALSTSSDAAVPQILAVASPVLHRPGGLELDFSIASLSDYETFWGVFDELQREGDNPRMPGRWEWVVGPEYVATGHEKHSITLVVWTRGDKTAPHYLGRVGTIAVFGQ